MALGPIYVAQRLTEPDAVRGVALLMRHGETAWNREGRVMGRHPVELNELGRSQVEAAARAAQAIKPDLIVSSPLVRARQSAEILSAGLGGIEIVEEPRISEVLYGRWEGMAYNELVGDEEYLNYRKSPLENRTPGGETIAEVQTRGVEAVMHMVGQHRDRRILFVSHGDIIRTVICYFMKLDLKHFHRLRIDNATFSAIQIAGEFAEVKFLNLLPDPGRAFIAPFPMRKPAKQS